MSAVVHLSCTRPSSDPNMSWLAAVTHAQLSGMPAV